MLRRWEHDPVEWLDKEYIVSGFRVFGRGWDHTSADNGLGPHDKEPMRMTPDVELPAVRESLRAAVEHYAAELLNRPIL